MNNEIEKKEELDFSKDKLDLIRNTICKGATQEEFEMFIELSKRYQLDPFKKQIFYIPDRNGGIMVSHAGLVHIAHQSGAWAGMKTFIVTKDGEEKLLVNSPNEIAGAVCYVYRKDWKEPLIHAVSFREYFRTIDDPEKQKLSSWYRMPQTMIKKVAEAGALRRAFDLGGLYIQEEMGIEMSNEYEAYEKVELPEVQKEEKNESNKVYLIRIMSTIEAIEKKFGTSKEKLIKSLENKLGAKLELFSIEQFKQAEKILNAYIEKQKNKQKQSEIEFEIKVEEPNEEKKEIDDDEWIKKAAEAFKDI